MKARLSAGLVWFAILASITYASDTAHLVPVEPDFGVSQPLGTLFKETYEKSLFAKKRWLIRYYRADTPVNVTIAFSIYLKGQTFWVNVSHATPEMDPLIREAAEKDRFDVSSVLGQIDLKSFDFPISKSTATALSNVWRSLLSEVTPDPSLRNRVFTDGPLVILFAKDDSNRILSGRVPPSAEQDAKFRQVEEVFTDLMKACTASKTERAKIYRDIELRSQAISDTLREEQNDQDHSLSTTAEAQPEHIPQLLDGKASSNDPDVRNRAKARSWEQRSEASDSTPPRPLTVSSATELLPARDAAIMRLLSDGPGPLQRKIAALPPCVLPSLRHWYEKPFVLVEQGQDFPKLRDIRRAGDGQFRLLFFAELKDGNSVLCFEDHTSLGITHRAVILRSDAGKCSVIMDFAFDLPLNSLEQLQVAINTQRNGR